FVGEREATVADVRGVVSSTHTGYIFNIGDALVQRNLPETLELIEDQLRSGQNAIGLLFAAIFPKIRSLLYGLELQNRHGIRAGRDYNSYVSAIDQLPPEEWTFVPKTTKGKPNAYPIFSTARYARNFTFDELKTAYELCLDANLRLVTTGMDPDLVLKQLVTRILHRSS
ncbi:MAG: hypothetical protein HKN23_03370, partial [Verrucomicrobiales bacterium]|nr:hypothetical protein [Verrucomicrobiales bacterium]